MGNIVKREEGSEIDISSIQSQRIKTVEDLLDYQGITYTGRGDSLQVDGYEILDRTANTWEQAQKNEDTKEVDYVSLFQVKVRLRKLTPEYQKFPVIHPVSFNHTYKPSKKPVNSKMKRALIVPDSQNGYSINARTRSLDPFHDRKAWDLVMQMNAEYKPDKVVFLGDMLDLPDWSDHFVRSPDVYFTTQPALYELGWILAKMRKENPHGEFHYIEGNHEYRLTRHIMMNTAEAYGLKRYDQEDSAPLFSVPYLLNLEKLGIEYHGGYPMGRVWINDNLACEHGDSAKSGSGVTAKSIIDKLRYSVIFGHIHKIETIAKTLEVRDGVQKTYIACSPGSICRLDGSVPGSNTNKLNWQNGIAMVDYEEGNGKFSINTIPIYNGECIYNQKKYSGKGGYITQVEKDTKWRF